MKSLLCISLLSSLITITCAQEATPALSNSQIKAGLNTTSSGQVEPSRSISKPSKPTPVAHSNFQERLKSIVQRGDGIIDQPLHGNYQIQIDRMLKGKPVSFSIMTADAKFTYQGLGTAVVVDENSIPGTINLEGELSHESEGSIFFQFYFGQTIPYVSGTFRGPNGTASTSQIQMLNLGMKNGATFPFGTPLKIVESDEESLVITIRKVER